MAAETSFLMQNPVAFKDWLQKERHDIFEGYRQFYPALNIFGHFDNAFKAGSVKNCNGAEDMGNSMILQIVKYKFNCELIEDLGGFCELLQRRFK